MIDRYVVSLVPTTSGRYVVLLLDFPEGFSQGENIVDAIDMAEDVLNTLVEEYGRSKKELPTPSDYETIIKLTKDEIASHPELKDPNRDIQYQLIRVPNTSNRTVPICVSMPARVLSRIDDAAKQAGMTRSGYLVHAATMYEAHTDEINSLIERINK